MNRQLRAIAMSPFILQRLAMVMPTERGSDLVRLAEFMSAGQVTPRVDRSYPLAQAPEAIRRLAAGDARGKLVITV